MLATRELRWLALSEVIGRKKIHLRGASKTRKGENVSDPSNGKSAENGEESVVVNGVGNMDEEVTFKAPAAPPGAPLEAIVATLNSLVPCTCGASTRCELKQDESWTVR